MNTLPTTWAEVAKQKGIPESVPFDLLMLPTVTQNYLIAAYKLPIIIEVLNGDWAPDYVSLSQPKYEIFFRIIADKERPSGFGLACFVDVIWLTYSTVGVRFCFKDGKTAEHAFNNFRQEFEHFILKIG